ncbi:MAG TPA: hypothetical protein VGC65_08750 [Bacteroidia bacterium]
MAALTEKRKNSAIYILCILSFLTALFYNEHNLRHLPSDSLREGGTVITSDDASYLNPPRNYLNDYHWQEDYWGGKIGSFIRPPGYGLLYLPFLKFLGETSAITSLKFFQYLLFAVSVFWFYSILLLLIKNRKIALLCSFFYGCSPFVVGFLSYTLTEGITPAILLFHIYCLFKALHATSPRQKNGYYIFAAVVFAFLFIVRPLLGIFAPLLPAFVIYDLGRFPWRTWIFRLIAFTSIAFSFMIVWQVRNYKIAGEYVGLHPVYYEDGNTIFRAPFREYWDFAGGWAERGDAGFSYMVPMWEAAITGDTSYRHVRLALNSLPPQVVSFYGEPRLASVFKDYQSTILDQKYFYDQQLPMPLEQLESEKKSVKGFRELADEYKKEFPLQYYVLSPIKVFRLLAFHSNLSLFIFQRTYRGDLWMESLRVLCFLLHGSCFLFLFISMFLYRKEWIFALVFGWVPFIYVFYLCYIQRGVEERYTLPVLPLLMIGLAHGLHTIYKANYDRIVAFKARYL